MKFYVVSEAYANYLRGFDNKVPQTENPQYQQKKLFIGIVLCVKGTDYLAPLSSYKEYHDRIPPSSATCFKLYEVGNPENKLGIINLKFTIPVLLNLFGD